MSNFGFKLPANKKKLGEKAEEKLALIAHHVKEFFAEYHDFEELSELRKLVTRATDFGISPFELQRNQERDMDARLRLNAHDFNREKVSMDQAWTGRYQSSTDRHEDDLTESDYAVLEQD